MKSGTIILTVLLLLALLSGCSRVLGGSTAPEASAPTPTPTLTSFIFENPLPRSMKGYELYSWQEDDLWYFTLITGTNRNKTLEEITSKENQLTGDGWVKVTVQGAEALKAVLGQVPPHEHILWLEASALGQAPSAGVLFTLPPREVVAGLQEFGQSLDLDLQVTGQAQQQQLRIINQSDIPLQNLIVIFPEERIEFGDVPARETTGYRPAPRGVYPYAAYHVELNGQAYAQPVIDWVGESPMPGDAFTYILDADPSRWEAEGWVIRLVEVVDN